MPLDVRKRSALPSISTTHLGLRPPKPGRSPKFKIELAGRPEAFSTSDGTAVDLKKVFRQGAFDQFAGRICWQRWEHHSSLSRIFQHANEWQIAIALGEIETVADDELVRNLESEIVDCDIRLSAFIFI